MSDGRRGLILAMWERLGFSQVCWERLSGQKEQAKVCKGKEAGKPVHILRTCRPEACEGAQWSGRRGSRIQAETILEGLEAGLPQAVSSGLSLVLAPGLVLTCPSAHSGPEGTASEAPPTRLRKAFLAQSTLLESPEPREGAPECVAPHPEKQRRSPSACSQHTPPLPSIPMGPPPCPPGENDPLCPRSGRGGGHCSIPPSLPSSSTFSLFSSGRWNPSVKVRVRKSQSQGRAGQLI
ncbi:LOW QUALITY PROTEIN: uncharacterized protein C3orf36-like [Macaca thibetana thibetana]|uniref:LOW QUALITY PROTEIN: uncharacterized protein C3orf36-like n=1 Tax=Macaca thibetana thibetana TaxID=257877 RepID=UPI0021BCA7AA|nr:LOW QUALITY PROTEIN: uncharacterized protein C3orf36-like [Macaca thibetana thibetana]